MTLFGKHESGRGTYLTRTVLGLFFLTALFTKGFQMIAYGPSGLCFFLVLLAFGSLYTLANVIWMCLGEETAPVVSSTPEARIWRSVEDRLDELERLKRRDMVTPEEYGTKRQEILKDL